jgi:hypothetical protein
MRFEIVFDCRDEIADLTARGAVSATGMTHETVHHSLKLQETQKISGVSAWCPPHDDVECVDEPEHRHCMRNLFLFGAVGLSAHSDS